MKSRAKSDAWPTVLLLALFTFLAAGAHDAQAQDGSKGIQPVQTGVGNRPQSKAGATKQQRPQRKYRPSKPFKPAPPSAGQEEAQLGVTVWRFRPSVGSDQAKELVDEGGDEGKREWTPERIEVETPLAVGEKVRLTIESLSRKGYLYVIDREQYADGSKGAARLIFPTLRTRGGNNYVGPGQLIDIPAAPRYFSVRQGTPGKVLVAEILTVLVTHKPLDLPSPIGERALTLPEELPASWERRWKTEVVKLELEGGAGQAMTVREQVVGLGNAKNLVDEDTEELTQDDPSPQTIYQTMIRPGDALLVTVPLLIQASPPRSALRDRETRRAGLTVQSRR